MTEPVTAGFGIKIASVVGGAVGSAITLAHLPKLGAFGRCAAYMTGLSFAAYAPPIVSYAFSLPSALDGPLGFMAGVGGMGFAGAIVSVSRDPIGAWRRFRGADNQTPGADNG